MVDETILKDFGVIWPRHVSSLTQFLIDCRQHFDGDLDLFLVLCIVGDRTFASRHVPPEMDFETWHKAEVIGVQSEDINTQSISDFSSIPRETVRRKLNVLVEKGWVTRDERGFITATTKAKTDLAPLTQSSLKYLTKMKAVFTDA